MDGLNLYNLQSCGACVLCGKDYPPGLQKPKQKVDGEGPLPCDIFLLGEAPGEEENKTGRPFVGMSGQFLRQCIRNTQIDKARIRIGNTVRCRPPNNRVPEYEEKLACSAWLKMELDLARPQVIVALGGSAISWFFGGYTLPKKSKVGTYVNKIFTYYAGVEPLMIPVVGSYHPAARMASQRLQVEKALRLAGKIVGLDEDNKVDYKLEILW